MTVGGNVVVTGGAVGWFVTAEYDSAGGEVFTRTEPASGIAGDVAIDPAGGIWVVGATYSVASGNEYLIVNYDSVGNPISSYTLPGYAASRVAADGSGNVIVTGYATPLPGRGYIDWLTHKMTPAGMVLWTKRYDQHAYNDEFPYAITVGPDGEAYITGQGGPGPTSGELSYLRTVTVRYDADGTEAWVASTFDSVRGLGVARAANGSVVVVGQSPYLVLHYMACTAVPGVTSGLRAVRAGGDVQITWSAAPGAGAYNVWTVTAKQDVDLARASSAPPAVGVAGCSPPSSAPAATCLDPGAIDGAPSPLFYQVRGVCPGQAEGP